MEWARILAYITRSVDHELLLRNEYLIAENRILKAQLQGRLRLSDDERARLGEIGHRLGRKALSEAARLGFLPPQPVLESHPGRLRPRARWRYRHRFAAIPANRARPPRQSVLAPPAQPARRRPHGPGVAKIHEHTIAHIFRDELVEAANYIGDALLIRRVDLAQILWVHARRECRRTYQIGEHHCDLAAVGGV
jgi:hypothetical protein